MVLRNFCSRRRAVLRTLGRSPSRSSGKASPGMAAPVKVLKQAILAGHFRHGANLALRMCFGNVMPEKDAAENEKFTQSQDGCS